jgi:uncharacterized protein YbcI
MSSFEQEYMGRGSIDIHAHLIDDLILVRLWGVLTAAVYDDISTVTGEEVVLFSPSRVAAVPRNKEEVNV